MDDTVFTLADVFFLVRPKGPGQYQISIACKKGVVPYLPALPPLSSQHILSETSVCREYLLSKCKEISFLCL